MKKLIVILGPTAVGKTSAAIAVADKLATEIISADSRQIFTEMNVGTAKPTKKELGKNIHHFISTKSIHEPYNAGQYGREALTLIDDLFKKYDSLVMVGGSGLYIKAVLEGFDEMPIVPDGLREKITEEYKTKGLTWLQKEVRKIDPDYFSIVDQQNPHRLMRALELVKSSGKSVHSLRADKKMNLLFEAIKIGLNIPREELNKRIDSRMDRMIEAGLFEEARQLYSFKNLNALQTVGYQEVFDYMDRLYDHEEAVRVLKRNSRRYAKRQLTWFQRDKEILWFENEVQILEWLTKQSL
jgi:tRNA dimethylallyltransferase